MRTTINIAEDLLELAKRQARARRISLGEVVEEALRQAFVERGDEAAPAFELVTFHGDGPREGVDLDRTSSLLAAEDEQSYRKG